MSRAIKIQSEIKQKTKMHRLWIDVQLTAVLQGHHCIQAGYQLPVTDIRYFKHCEHNESLVARLVYSMCIYLQVIILEPTRELANQVAQDIKDISDSVNIVCLYGGAAYNPQRMYIYHMTSLLFSGVISCHKKPHQITLGHWHVMSWCLSWQSHVFYWNWLIFQSI